MEESSGQKSCPEARSHGKEDFSVLKISALKTLPRGRLFRMEDSSAQRILPFEESSVKTRQSGAMILTDET